MIKINNKNYRHGTLVLEEIKFDHVFKRKVMKSGNVAKVYLPKELIGETVYIICDLNNVNNDNVSV